MKVKTKRMSSYLFLGVLVSFILLAGSLSTLELHPGRTFLTEHSDDSGSRIINAYVSQIGSSSTFMQGVLGIASILIIILILSRLILHLNISHVGIRKNLGYITILALILCVIYIFTRIGTAQSINGLSENLGEFPPAVPDSVPYQIGEVPRTLIWLVAGILGGGICVLMVISVVGLLSPTQVTDPLIREAENAVDKLRAGMDLSDVIIQCYSQMAQTLREQRGIERNHNMTVREFEHWLEDEGLPPGPVRQLTSLFEAARYSKRQMGNEDEINALQCLNEIIRHCRGVQ